jgi:hypothetical protein
MERGRLGDDDLVDLGAFVPWWRKKTKRRRDKEGEKWGWEELETKRHRDEGTKGHIAVN